jgi:hypothetical protein
MHLYLQFFNSFTPVTTSTLTLGLSSLLAC